MNAVHHSQVTLSKAAKLEKKGQGNGEKAVV